MRSLDAEKAVVLFSGGQDSAVVLAWALDRYRRVETIGFDYGQRHGAELDARQTLRHAYADLCPLWSERLGGDVLLDLGALGAISETALTRRQAIAMTDDGLPSTFVPGRNLIFLAMAGALAYRSGAGALVGGMCETDYSGYPDCRRAAIDAQMDALRLGMDAPLTIETPLMALSKAQSWALAEKIGGAALVDAINEHSHTCYLGDRSVRHDWGYGCGRCPACDLRADGWRAYASSRVTQ